MTSGGVDISNSFRNHFVIQRSYSQIDRHYLPQGNQEGFSMAMLKLRPVSLGPGFFSWHSHQTLAPRSHSPLWRACRQPVYFCPLPLRATSAHTFLEWTRRSRRGVKKETAAMRCVATVLTAPSAAHEGIFWLLSLLPMRCRVSARRRYRYRLLGTELWRSWPAFSFRDRYSPRSKPLSHDNRC